MYHGVTVPQDVPAGASRNALQRNADQPGRIFLVVAEEWILLVGRDIQLGMAAQVLEQGSLFPPSARR